MGIATLALCHEFRTLWNITMCKQWPSFAEKICHEFRTLWNIKMCKQWPSFAEKICSDS